VALPRLSFVWRTDGAEKWALEVFDVPVVSGTVESSDDIDRIAREGMLAVRRNINLFFGMEQTNRLLNQASDSSPEVVKEVQRGLSLQAISAILRNLVEEEVPIKNINGALEAIAAASVNEKDLQNLTEYARISLGRQLSHKYAVDGVVEAIGLSLTLEEELLNLMRDNGGKAELGASPQFAELVTSALKDAIDTLEPAVIVAPVVLRRQLRGLIADSCFEIPVLSYAEIVKPFSLNILSRVELNPAADQVVNG
jgi:type III secretion protein V